MSVRDLLKNINEDTPIPIVIDNDTGTFLLQSYVRRYHVFMKV